MIFHPRSITVKQIEQEENAELRRTLIEIYGQARYLQDAGATEIHSDPFGVLYRKELRGEFLMMVRVIDATTMEDGTAREYFMPVDNQLRPLPDGDWPASAAANSVIDERSFMASTGPKIRSADRPLVSATMRAHSRSRGPSIG